MKKKRVKTCAFVCRIQPRVEFLHVKRKFTRSISFCSHNPHYFLFLFISPSWGLKYFGRSIPNLSLFSQLNFLNHSPKQDRRVSNFLSLQQLIDQCPLHVFTFTLISNLATDYIQKRRGEPSLFSLNIICRQIWYQSKSDYMDRAILNMLFSVSSMCLDFQKSYEGEIWCLCTVTFSPKVPKLNSRPV